MKKVFAVLLVLAMVFCAGMVAFAEPVDDSPVAGKIFQLKYADGIGHGFTSYTIREGQSKTFTADPEKGKFDSWSFYRSNGSVAKEGKDYTIVSGTATTIEIEFEPYVDVIVTANYNGKITDPLTAGEKKPVNPKTGDFNEMALVWMIGLAALSMVVVSKKQLSK